MATQRVDIRVPEELLRRIEEYQKAQAITTRTAAMLELIRLGLKYSKKDDH